MKTIELTSYGYRAVRYTDDDGDSGYGDHARVGYWYGTREACEAVPESAITTYPMDARPDPDPFDLACERRYD